MDGGERRRQGNEGPGGGRRPGFKGTAENSKTKICQRWERGDCRFGDRCNFAHGVEELRRAPGHHRADSAAMLLAQTRLGPQAFRPGLHQMPGLGPSGSLQGGLPGSPGPLLQQPGQQLPLQMPYPLTTSGLPAHSAAAASLGLYGGPLGFGLPGQQQQQQMPPAQPQGALQAGLTPLPQEALTPEERWIQQGRPVQGPGGWTAYTTPDTGEAYYFNALTQQTQWERPQEWPL